ncbi:hypothetical protein LTR66_013764 [Elasticomyces elasticus]|nr:hypothetical protein LTR66_013764 [Elasticomyces elasticus]
MSALLQAASHERPARKLTLRTSNLRNVRPPRPPPIACLSTPFTHTYALTTDTMLSRRLLSPAFRTAPLRRTYASSGGLHGAGEKGLKGAADNAFNRERAAVKAHAAESSDLWRKLSI